MEHEQDQVTAYTEKLQALGETPVRRWSFEAEHVGIARARSNSTWSDYKHFDFVIDGSVETEFDFCDCSCNECNYHECNCENCDSQNDSPDHCADDSCTANELCPSAPLATAWRPEFEPFLVECQESADRYGYEDFGRLGGHLHVEARDLTPRQAVNAVIIAEHVFKIAPEWFTGTDDNYNNPTDRRSLEDWSRGISSGRRDVWASVNNLSYRNPQPYTIGDLWDHRKTTIEFRRFRTTFDAQILQIRGGFARAVVAYAKSNGPIYWATRSNDFAEVLAEIGFGKH